MRITDPPLDPEVQALVDVPQGKFVSLGSDVAVDKEAPVVTGDAVMDTQLENMRRLLCDRVWATYNLTTRAKKIRLWATESKWDDGKQSKIIPPSMVKRDDHPWVAVLIRQAQELATIDAIPCEKTTVDKFGEEHTFPDRQLELTKSQTRLKLLADIQATVLQIEKAGAASLDAAQDLIKSFHQMAQAFKIHREKLDAAGVDVSDAELTRIAARAKDTTHTVLESFLEPPKDDDEASGAVAKP